MVSILLNVLGSRVPPLLQRKHWPAAHDPRCVRATASIGQHQPWYSLPLSFIDFRQDANKRSRRRGWGTGLGRPLGAPVHCRLSNSIYSGVLTPGAISVQAIQHAFYAIVSRRFRDTTPPLFPKKQLDTQLAATFASGLRSSNHAT